MELSSVSASESESTSKPFQATHIFNSRKWNCGSCDQNYTRLPVHDLDRHCYYVNSNTYKARNIAGRRGGEWRKGRYDYLVSGRREKHLLRGKDDAEAILSFLTEGTDDECFDFEERYDESFRKFGVNKVGKNVGTRSIAKKSVNSGVLKSESRYEHELIRVRNDNERNARKDDRIEEEREHCLQSENYSARERKEGPSCSSYCSFSSLEEFVTDNEVGSKHEDFIKESSNGHKSDTKSKDETRYNEKINKEDEWEECYQKEHGAVVKRGNIKLASGNTESDWRKKSEKKLMETGFEESRSRKESLEKHSKLSTAYEFGQSDFYKGCHNKEDKISLEMNTDNVSSKKYSHSADWVSGRSETEAKHKRSTEIKDAQVTDAQRTQISQKQSSGREKNADGYVNLVQDLHGEHLKATGQITTVQDEQRKNSQSLNEVSDGMEMDIRVTSSSQAQSEFGKKWAESSTMSMTTLGISNEQSHQAHLQINSERVSCPQASSQFKFQYGLLQIDADERKRQNPEALLTVPSSVIQEDSGKSQKVGTIESPTCRQESLPALHDEIHDGAGKVNINKESFSTLCHGDAISSAQHLQESSTQFVGEFVEKLRHEVSTSEIRKETNIYEMTVVSSAEQHKQNISNLNGSGGFQSEAHSLTHSSQSSGAKGPSDEMWDVADPSIQKSPKTEVPEEAAVAQQLEVRRTGKSLWNLIGDIIRLRWGSHSETRSSASKRSCGRSSRNQSTSSDAWYSGHEPDENIEEKLKKEMSHNLREGTSIVDLQQRRPEELAPFDQQQGRSPTQRQDVPSAVILKDKLNNKDGSLPSSSIVIQSGLTSKVVSSTLVEENLKRNSEGTFSGNVFTETSFPLPAAQVRRSSSYREISGPGENDVSGSEVSGRDISSGCGTDGKDGELKRRKLQRSSQVPRDSIDEWEEAYRIEAEQRKTDEMFMREALLEAQKAADTWETPVGAVLVQNGKIIARGYNLVEELRDSTAHAEMICIREASNILSTWRLSETTLYVTLEPCPMCAGAILQARVDTVVWGAPNKLLGADGSWIRLFPGGEDGSRLEPSDKPCAPVHPFHPKITIRRGILASECADKMQQFFQLRRKKKETKQEPPTPPPTSCLPVPNRPSKFFSKLHDAFTIFFCVY